MWTSETKYHKESRTREVNYSRSQEFEKSRIPEVKKSRNQEIKNSRIQEVKKSRSHEVNKSWTQEDMKSKTAWIRSQSSEFQNFQVQKWSKSTCDIIISMSGLYTACARQNFKNVRIAGSNHVNFANWTILSRWKKIHFSKKKYFGDKIIWRWLIF